MQKPKNQWVAFFLALFFGGFGAHKFYLANPKSGLIRLLFFWTFIPALVALWDALVILNMPDWKWDFKINGVPIPEEIQKKLDPKNYLSNDEVLKRGLKKGIGKAISRM